MSLHVLIVQHAEKEPTSGDPGLTETGHQQARACGVALARLGPFDEIWTSPLRRTMETATHLAVALGMPEMAILQDGRIRERMNWPGEPHQTRADFGWEWARSTADRDFQPAFGDSSRTAGARFAAFPAELHDRLPDGCVIVVAHGGVTIDLVRTWFGDDRVEELAPGVIERGIQACRVTAITLGAHDRSLLGIGAAVI